MKTWIMLILLIVAGLAQAQHFENVEEIGSLFNYWIMADEIKVYDSTAYVIDVYSGLQIVDVSDPENLQSIRCVRQGLDTPQDILKVHDKLYIADEQEGLVIYDVTEPQQPEYIRNIPLQMEAHKLAYWDEYLYIQGNIFFDSPQPYPDSSCIVIFDIGFNLEPQLVGSCGFEMADHGIVTDMYVDDGLCLISARRTGLIIIAVGDPENPYVLSVYEADRNIYSVVAQDDYAYCAMDRYGLAVIDIANPWAPHLISTLGNTNRSGVDLSICGNTAAICGLTIDDPVLLCDIANPERLSILDTLTSDNCNGMFLSETSLFTINSTNMEVFNVNDPENGQLSGGLDMSGRLIDVKVTDNKAFVGNCDSLYCFDFSDPQNPSYLSSLVGFHFINNLEYRNGFLYFIDSREPFNCDLLTVDVRNSENMVIVDRFETGAGLGEIAFKDNYMFSGGWRNGLYIFDIANPQSPRLISEIDTTIVMSVMGIDFYEDYVFVITGSGLKIFWINDIENPQLTGRLFMDGIIKDIVIMDNYLYITSGMSETWISIYDISDAQNLLLVNTVDLGRILYNSMERYYENLLVNCHMDGLKVYSLADPENPVETGYFNGMGNAINSSVLRPDVLIAANMSSLGIYDCSRSLNTKNHQGPFPTEFELINAYPNPFNANAIIRYSLPIQSKVTLRIYNARGQLVDVLMDRIVPAGSHSVVWDGSSFSTGVYFVNMTDHTKSMNDALLKIVLIK